VRSVENREALDLLLRRGRHPRRGAPAEGQHVIVLPPFGAGSWPAPPGLHGLDFCRPLGNGLSIWITALRIKVNRSSR
jgi:hypothetical protein